MHLSAIVLFSTLPALAAAAAVGFALAMPKPPTEFELALRALAGRLTEIERQMSVALQPALARALEAMREFNNAWQRPPR